MKLKNRTILITGGAGFIGGHLSEALAKDNRVIVYDNFSSSVVSLSYLRHLRNASVIKGDILDFKKLTRAMRGTDVVFHLAVSGVRASLSQPLQVHAVNCTGTLTALLSAKAAGVKHFLYISSSEIYGGTIAHAIKETDKPHPTTVYGESKLMGERYSLLFHREEKLPVTIIRPFNTYGPRSHFEDVYGELIPRTVIRLLNGKPPLIFGSGRQTRDFTFVEDTVRGIIKAAENSRAVGEIINIARGHEVSVREAGQTICAILGVPFRPLFKPARPHDIARLAADTAKAKKLLRYSATMTLKRGLKRYIAWLKTTYPDQRALLRRIPEKNW